jgi:hypothetical protein
LEPAGLTLSNDSGDSGSDLLTNVKAGQVLSGSAENGIRLDITVTDGTSPQNWNNVDSDGSWSTSSFSIADDGDYDVNILVKDLAGNQRQYNSVDVITYDTVAPTLQGITLPEVTGETYILLSFSDAVAELVDSSGTPDVLNSTYISFTAPSPFPPTDYSYRASLINSDTQIELKYYDETPSTNKIDWPDDSYTLTLTAAKTDITDAAGNELDLSTISLTILSNVITGSSYSGIGPFSLPLTIELPDYEIISSGSSNKASSFGKNLSEKTVSVPIE